ncbi:MAG: glycosyltransferase family 39 protein [Deltaproteobacteria bacterium]|nr:glycosyltransferase family 39 protein [Deltaproteobacteria bacterium]
MTATTRLAPLARRSLAVSSLFTVVAAAFVILGRLTFPWELEFMTGSVMDHIERVRAGQPIYVEPSSEFIPFLYPPVYYWLAALLGGTTIAARSISIAASLVQGILVWRLTRGFGASRFWAFVGVGCFAGCFRYVGYWYDLERADSLLGALVVVAAALLVGSRRLSVHFVAGVICGIGCFTKQQAVFYVAGAAGGLLAAHRASDADRSSAPREAAAFGAGVAVAAFGLLFYVRGDWAAYYLLRMPRAHGLMPELVGEVFARDLVFGPLLFASTIAASYHALVGVTRRSVTRAEIVFCAILAAGFAGAISSRIHIGGWINVLVPWTTFACVALAVACARLEQRRSAPKWTLALSLAVVAQIGLWGYDPRAVLPKEKTLAGIRAFRERVASFEKEGEVVVAGRGNVTTPRRFHIAALADVVRVDGHSPPDLVAKLRARRFSAIFDDVRPFFVNRNERWPPILLEDVDDLRQPILANYFVAERLDPEPIGLALRAPLDPMWIYRPRKNPLETTDLVLLRKHQLAEASLAGRRADALARGQAAPFSEAEIEERAAAYVAAHPATPWEAGEEQKTESK